MNLAVTQRTNGAGFPKPGELIEITGAHALEASDRAILNLLYQHVHDSGRMGETNAEWSISLSALRFDASHKGNERVADSLDRLLRVIANVPYTLADGEPRILKTHLFDFFDLPSDETWAPPTNVRFGLPKMLQPVLVNSNRWGRIKAEVVCAMTSKYAIALYELVQLRANMDRCVETFPLARFRDLMGVPSGRLLRAHDFERFVLHPAKLEVNGLSDTGVDVAIKRRSVRAPIEAIIVTWWPKDADEHRAAVRERAASKVGRMARLRGVVETVSPAGAA
ncbi:MAG: replication initiation protein [Pseudomonadota bacterium]|nr:replication initiation protein [Pseudomonadota bacterium]